MITTKIPCNGCILLPICKSKIKVECNKIVDFMIPYMISKYYNRKKYKLAKDKIFDILIHTIRIRGFHENELFTFYSNEKRRYIK